MCNHIIDQIEVGRVHCESVLARYNNVTKFLTYTPGGSGKLTPTRQLLLCSPAKRQLNFEEKDGTRSRKVSETIKEAKVRQSNRVGLINNPLFDHWTLTHEKNNVQNKAFVHLELRETFVFAVIKLRGDMNNYALSIFCPK